MKPDGTKSTETPGDISIAYPVTIQWVEGLRQNLAPDPPGATSAELYTFHGLPSGTKVLREEASLILVFTGVGWEGYYVAGKAGLTKDAIRELVEQSRSKGE